MFFQKNSNKVISFTPNVKLPKEFHPYPADRNIPSWYKDTISYIGGEKKPDGNGKTTATIKRCMPVFDSMTAGYIIPTPADVYVSQREGQPYYEWSGFSLIEFHPNHQASKHPKSNGNPYPKWINPWSIKTAPGYSTLFVQPFHRDSVFTSLPGLVDTDEYSVPVNFPFVLNDPKFEGFIPAGTPMIQAIPVKRDSWVSVIGKEEDRLQEQAKSLSHFFFDSYKKMFRQKKEYK